MGLCLRYSIMSGLFILEVVPAVCKLGQPLCVIYNSEFVRIERKWLVQTAANRDMSSLITGHILGSPIEETDFHGFIPCFMYYTVLKSHFCLNK
jgi:hypothetical protein